MSKLVAIMSMSLDGYVADLGDPKSSTGWEPHKYASKAEQDSMLEHLQAWVAGYYSRQDQWSYHAHRRIFDSFTGTKSERGDGHEAHGVADPGSR